ncbi:DNA replication and repair protein RecF [Hoeflea marina]|uniref:DNA replication and repair protein RecF n=1 Tax=Hoeflea marina TaxID=274592 RepID=A0A317PJS3_9HYPH|nr:DNA replication/repair protein RecF [Hoeflea marina]PWW00146.1 DNA replication and repair protein RecF [Hoeflea marina]
MHILKLKLGNFRNYTQMSVEFDPRHVVLVGDNGAGKTNLMEAVSLLTPGRGLRRAAYADIPRAGAEQGFSVFASLDGMAGDVDIGTGIEAGDATRRVRINGAPARSADDMLEHLRILWLTPAMDGLFTGTAGDRRRFLDRLVLSVDPAHGRRAADYERAMRSRNRLLSEGRADPVWLDGLEGQMAELGIAMAIARQEVVGMLSSLVDRHGDAAVFPTASLRLEGFADAEKGLASSEQESWLIDQLRVGRHRDAAAGRTLEGPHRADLVVEHRAKDIAAALCSTGEQKALLIGLILAHARLVRDMAGHAPLLLLDEIAAHLDEGRRAALFDLVDALGGQAFMTGTDRGMFSALGERAQMFEVSGGKVTGLGAAGA